MSDPIEIDMRLRTEDGALCQQRAEGDILAVFASGAVPPGGPNTAEWLAGVREEAEPASAVDVLDVLRLLHEAAREDRLVFAAAVRCQDSRAEVGWVGDVRVHLVRDGRLVRSTREHSKLRELGLEEEAPSATRAQLARITTRALGSEQHTPEREVWDLKPRDTLLFCAAQFHDFRPPSAYLAEALDFERPDRSGRLSLRP